MLYTYTVTAGGINTGYSWGRATYKDGIEHGFKKSWHPFMNREDAEADARKNGKKVIETAQRFGRAGIEISADSLIQG